MTIANKLARLCCASLAAFSLMLGLNVAQAQTVIYYHTDALGSPVAITNAAGVVIERTEYEPYGQVLNEPVADGPGYTGHVSDAQTGLSYMQQRYYDPQLGRFLSVDPVTAYSDPTGSFNRYKYASNNPYRFTDPDGRCDPGQSCHEPIPFNYYTHTTPGRAISETLGNFAALFDKNHVNPFSGEILNQGQIQRTKEGLITLAMPVGRVETAIAATVERGFINPTSVRFSQDSARATFGRGGSVQGMADALRSGTLNANQVPAIRLVDKDGALFTLDNRRLEAFQRAGVDVPYRMATPEETAAEAWKFTTKNEGASIRLRGQ